MQNNPIAYVDYFGLASETNDGNKDEFQEYFYGEYEPHCFCERHRNCKRGGDVASAIGGAAHGVVDYMIGSLLDLQTTAALIRHAEWRVQVQQKGISIRDIQRELQRMQASILKDTVTGKRYHMPSCMSNKAKKIYQAMGVVRNSSPREKM